MDQATSMMLKTIAMKLILGEAGQLQQANARNNYLIAAGLTLAPTITDGAMYLGNRVAQVPGQIYSAVTGYNETGDSADVVTGRNHQPNYQPSSRADYPFEACEKLPQDIQDALKQAHKVIVPTVPKIVKAGGTWKCDKQFIEDTQHRMEEMVAKIDDKSAELVDLQEKLRVEEEALASCIVKLTNENQTCMKQSQAKNTTNSSCMQESACACKVKRTVKPKRKNGNGKKVKAAPVVTPVVQEIETREIDYYDPYRYYYG